MESELLKHIYEYIHYLIMGGGLLWSYKMLLKVISDKEDRKRIFSWVDNRTWWEAYSSLIGSLNSFLNFGFGNKLISFQSFKNAFRIAWVYPWILLFLFSLGNTFEMEAYIYRYSSWYFITYLYFFSICIFFKYAIYR